MLSAAKQRATSRCASCRSAAIRRRTKHGSPSTLNPLPMPTVSCAATSAPRTTSPTQCVSARCPISSSVCSIRPPMPSSFSTHGSVSPTQTRRRVTCSASSTSRRPGTRQRRTSSTQCATRCLAKFSRIRASDAGRVRSDTALPTASCARSRSRCRSYATRRERCSTMRSLPVTSPRASNCSRNCSARRRTMHSRVCRIGCSSCGASPRRSSATARRSVASPCCSSTSTG